MATTTNFGWETPDDTDLVKDGASAIRTLGSAIDTSLVDLKGGTTGQLLTKASNTDLDFSWADSTSGGITLISTTTFSGTSITLSSIPQTYNSLFLIIKGVTWNTGNEALRVKLNNSTTLHYTNQIRNQGATSAEFNVLTDNIINLHNGYNQTRTDANNAWILSINNYTSTDSYKLFRYNGMAYYAGGWIAMPEGRGVFRSTSAVTSILMDNSGLYSFLGGTVLLYGVK